MSLGLQQQRPVRVALVNPWLGMNCGCPSWVGCPRPGKVKDVQRETRARVSLDTYGVLLPVNGPSTIRARERAVTVQVII